jgi:hypothetical protein
VVEFTYAMNAEGKSLESVTTPLTVVADETGTPS